MTQRILIALAGLFVLVSAVLAQEVTVRQDSPKEVVETFIRAQDVLGWDAATLITHPDYRDAVATVAGAVKTFLSACMELADAVEAVHGKELADAIRGPLKEMGKDSEAASALKAGQVDWSKVKIEQSGDKASAMIAGRDQPLRLARVGKSWYVIPRVTEGKTVAQAQAEADAMKAQFARSTAQVKALTARVKAKELDPDQFAAEFAKAMPGPLADAPAQPGITVRQATPEQAVTTFLLAWEGMDVDVLAAVVVPQYQKQTQTAGKSLVRLLGQLEELAKSAEDKLGKDAASAVREEIKNLRSSPAAEAIKAGRVDWAKAHIQIDGDRGTVTIDGVGEPLRLKKVDGKWFVDPFGEKETPQSVTRNTEELVKDTDAKVGRLKALAGRVQAGQVKPDQFKSEFLTALANEAGQPAGEP